MDMLSMTGFGTGEGTAGPITITVEFRSVNHRFLDVSLKLPSLLAAYELDVRNFLKDNIARGRVSVSVQVEIARGGAASGADPERLAQGIRMVQTAAAELARATGEPAEPVKLKHLLMLPDLFRVEEPDLEPEDARAALMLALAGAARGLQEMKKAEGAALVREMNGRLDIVEAKLADVRKLAPLAAAEIQRKLNDRLEKLLSEPLEPQRLAQEVALLADRSNINEECERLGIHIEHFRAAFTEGGQVAKRINFLLQEMHREVNTMGSKTNLMDITQAVIVMKDEVESLREQIQNLE
ncbi:MAG: YicC family protein [bacterium]|nr:YicC family protein [bacterium]